MDYFQELIQRYRNKGILIDTNLLLIYFIGSYDASRIPRFKRTMAFTIEDFYTLLAVFKFFTKIVTTPNILTEVSNLMNQLPEDIKSPYYSEFANQIAVLEENYLESAKVSSSESFQKFGLTDSGIIELVKDKFLVLTDDFRLANYIQGVGIDVINFNHIRTLNWRPIK